MSGIVDLKEKKLVVEQGLFGFETITEYKLTESELPPFLWLQSAQEKSLAFLVVDPFIIFPDYELDIDDESLHTIDITSPSDVIVLTILTIPRDGKDVTANLQGPVIINKKNNKGMQIILADSRWTTKHPVLDQIKSRGSQC